MFFSVSSSGIYKDDFFNVEVTQMNPSEYPEPINKFTVFDIVVRSKDSQCSINLQDFSFYLFCEGKKHNPVNLTVNTELKQLIALYSNNDIRNDRYYQRTLILFEPIPEVHYKPTKLVFYYKPYKKPISISLTY